MTNMSNLQRRARAQWWMVLMLLAVLTLAAQLKPEDGGRVKPPTPTARPTRSATLAWRITLTMTATTVVESPAPREWPTLVPATATRARPTPRCLACEGGPWLTPTTEYPGATATVGAYP